MIDFNSISEATLRQILLTLAVIAISIILKWSFSVISNNHLIRNNLDKSRRLYLVKVINILITILVIGGVFFIWSVNINALATYFTAFFTVIGVGLFAQWSILSNITASFIIFFNFPFKVGSKIKIIDGDNSIVGIITDITLFTIRLTSDNNEHISYPNSLLLQKPIETIEKN